MTGRIDKMSTGRPTVYSEELTNEICRRLAEGESLKRICDSEGMPARSSVFLWLQLYPDFSNKYRQARVWQADTHADASVDIADQAVDRDNAAAIKVRVDARIWVASRMRPRIYGPRPDPDAETDAGKIEEGMTFRVVGVPKPTSD